MTAYRPLPARFFRQPAVQLARALLGKVLIHDLPDGRCAGRIVETEAYDEDDPASHSCRGRTERNRAMFKAGGISYVYRIYGVHRCMNVVADESGHGAAVLIRALEPLEGLEFMAAQRGLANGHHLKDLASGPGRLCQAMAITRAQDGASLLEPPLWIGRMARARRPPVKATPRIGISKATDRLWRFCIPAHACVSGPSAWR